MHRGIATLSGAVMICFLLLTEADPNFFHLQLLQSAIYLMVILMLFYFEDHWAYMLGMIAPAVWLLLSFGLGTIPGSWSEAGLLVSGRTAVDRINALDILTATMCTLMIIFSARRWKREYAGSGKGMLTFLATFIGVAVYYGILIYVFWKGIPRG
jgi:multisubunit Na+/H+ antiporter MnhF subunit